MEPEANAAWRRRLTPLARSALRIEARYPTVKRAAGHYESVFLRAAAPAGGQALWLRHVIDKPPGESGTPSLWLTWFDDAAPAPFQAKTAYDIAALAFPEDAFLAIGGAVIGPGRATGSMPSDLGELVWELVFDDGPDPFDHLSRGWMYRGGFPRTKVRSPYPASRISGRVRIGERTIELHGWPGMVGHNWGREHAETWAWIDAVGLDGDRGCLDLVLGRVRAAGRLTPWIANGVVAFDGERHRIGGFRRTRGVRVSATDDSCAFAVKGTGIAVRGIIELRPPEVATWPYDDPSSGVHRVRNGSIADLELTVEQTGETKSFAARGSATYELGVLGHGASADGPRGAVPESAVPRHSVHHVSSATSTTGSVDAADGTPLLVRRWSTSGHPWARMLLIHGLAEHSGRYERAGRLLAEAGVDVTAFDLRGHGGSGGRRGDVERWTDYLDDLAARLAAMRAEADGRPIILFAHSYGGLISTDYVLSGRPAPDLLVLSAPALDDGLPRWQHTFGPLLARVWPTLALKNAWSPDALSRDPDVGRRTRLDPGCPERATTRMGALGFAAQERVRSTLAGLAVPTLVFHGSDDLLVPPRATEPFEGLPNVIRRVYPGLRHETLNEPEGPHVVADTVAWLREAVGLISTRRPPSWSEDRTSSKRSASS